jgi:hypothetical protein
MRSAKPVRVAAPAPTAAALAVFCKVGPHLVGIEGARVEQMVLVAEVEASVRGPASQPALVRIRGRWYGVRSAAELLGTKARAGALVLIQLPAPGAPVIALEVSACAKVAPWPKITAVPPGLSQLRAPILVGAFATRGLIGDEAGVGLVLDVAALATAAELAQIAGAIADQGASEGGRA